jgi:5-(carboxyamino)imidazole ribonucleotide synthase
MVGAGQLARMTSNAAAALGLTLRILAEHASDSAALVSGAVTTGSPRSLDDLRAFAAVCDVVTFDHELVAPEALVALQAAGVCMRPSPDALRFAQDKLYQRTHLEQVGIPVPPFRQVATIADVAEFASEQHWPMVLKAARFGYDGRGVWVVANPSEAHTVLLETAERHLHLFAEPLVAIEREVAVLVARRPGGQSVTYPVVETVQQDGMCREVIAPAPVNNAIALEAQQIAERIARVIDATGVLAVEFFVTADGLLVNELALRPHNSGHYSLGGCRTSQFENHLRAVLDWPLGEPRLLTPVVVTVNVVGATSGADPLNHLPLALGIPGVSIELYGKVARPGRKLGHVTALGDDLAETRLRAQRAANLLACGQE